MLDNHIFVLPIVVLIYIPVSFTITYGIAVAYGHVEPEFPYISDTGTFPPESCAFGQLLNIGALLCSMVIYTRYKQIEKFYRDSRRTKLLRLNKACFILGLSACLGLSVVGNFQETNVILIHMIGATLAFCVGGIYCCIQAAMSFWMTELPGSDLKMRIFRVVLCVADFISLVLCILNKILMGQYINNEYERLLTTALVMAGIFYDLPPFKMKIKTLVVRGYKEHLVSTTSEWAAGILTVIFLATFTGEFRKFHLKAPEVIFSENQKDGNNEPYASNIIVPAD